MSREPKGFWKCALSVSVEHGHLQLTFVSFKTFFLADGPEMSWEAGKVVLSSVHDEVAPGICMAPLGGEVKIW